MGNDIFEEYFRKEVMDDSAFDWFADIEEVDSGVDCKEPETTSALQNIFDFLIMIFRYIGSLFGSLLIIRYLFSANKIDINGANVDTLILCVTVFTGSLPVLLYFVRFLILIFKRIVSQAIERKVSKSYRWFALSIWFSTNIYLLKYVRDDIQTFHFHIHASLLSGLIISLTYAICSIGIEYFHEQFMRRNFFNNMVEAELREKILATMKQYRFEVSESTLTESLDCNCIDILCLRDSIRPENNENIRISLRDNNGVGNYCFKKPEITSVYDAKALAKDVYEKACQNQPYMTFNEFSLVFTSPELAVQAYSLFEPDEERRIPKKEFRDGVIRFYFNRANFDKSMHIARNFTNTVGQIVYIFISIILVIISLIIFGFPLKELFAVALSSALLLNFMASGMAADMYYNIMLLVSHPFDAGDEVIIKGVEYRVYRTGLSSTSFLALNGGKVKIMNSELWKTDLMNMTRAPEKLLVFQFTLPDSLTSLKIGYLKLRIHQYLKGRPYDFYETFSLEAKSEDMIDINTVCCHLVLKAKSFQSKSRKFSLRLEVNRFLTALIAEIKERAITEN